MPGNATVIVDDRIALGRIVAKEFVSRAAEAIGARGRFAIALPGGSVASAFLPVLAGAAVDWTRTDIFWIDERAVPPGDPESNYGLALRLLIEPAGVPSARVHRMPGELADLDEAARLASDALKSAAGDPPQLDLVLAGFGDDGHVASIFPNQSPNLPIPQSENSRVIQAVHDAPKPPARRLTMTMPVLVAARRVIVAGFGASKAAVMRDALHGAGSQTPVGELLRKAASPLVLLDTPQSH